MFQRQQLREHHDHAFMNISYNHQYQSYNLYFIKQFAKVFRSIQFILLPALVFIFFMFLELLVLIGLSNWQWFEKFIQDLKSSLPTGNGEDNIIIDYSHIVFVYSFAYSTFFILLGPRSLISTLSGYILGFWYGAVMDIFGIFIGNLSIVSFARLLVLPMISFFSKKKDTSQDHGVSNSSWFRRSSSSISPSFPSSSNASTLLSPSSSPLLTKPPPPSVTPQNEHLLASHHPAPTNHKFFNEQDEEKDEEDLRLTYFASFKHSVIQRVLLVQKLTTRVNDHQLVAVFNASPVFPIHITTYLLSLSQVNPIAVVFMVIIPYSFPQYKRGSSFTSLQDLLKGKSPAGQGDYSIYDWIYIISGVLFMIFILHHVKSYTERLAIEIQEDQQVGEMDIDEFGDDLQIFGKKMTSKPFGFGWEDQRDEQIYSAIGTNEPLPIILLSI